MERGVIVYKGLDWSAFTYDPDTGIIYGPSKRPVGWCSEWGYLMVSQKVGKQVHVFAHRIDNLREAEIAS